MSTLMQYGQADDFARRWVQPGAEVTQAAGRGAIAVLAGTPAMPVNRTAKGKPGSSTGAWMVNDSGTEQFVATADIRQYVAAGWFVVEHHPL
jgi:hypothetical protein